MALAPEQIGIGIRRHFTEAGTHPYDMVEWEMREARIQNFRDGTGVIAGPVGNQIHVEFVAVVPG